MAAIGLRIKEKREALGITQEELAQKLGYKNKSSIAKIETGTNDIVQSKVVEFATVLNTTVAYLMGWEESSGSKNSSQSSVIPNDVTISEYKHIKKYRNLTPSGQKHVDAVLEWETEHMEQLAQAASSPAAKPPFRLIQYYQRLASAGTGQYVFDSIPTEQIEIPDIPEYKKVQFALGANGLSMEPLYSHGDILLIEPTQDVQPGEIGIFLHNGESFVKELGDGVLHSLNDLYDDIELTEDTRCIGRVIDKLDAPISVSEELGKKLRALAKKTAEKHA